MRGWILIASAALALVRCVGDSSSTQDGGQPGTLGGPCFTGGACDPGLACVLVGGNPLCEAPDATVSDAAGDAPKDAPSDASDAAINHDAGPDCALTLPPTSQGPYCGDDASCASEDCCFPLNTGNGFCVPDASPCGTPAPRLDCTKPDDCNAALCCTNQNVTLVTTGGQCPGEPMGMNITSASCQPPNDPACPINSLALCALDVGCKDGGTCTPFVATMNSTTRLVLGYCK